MKRKDYLKRKKIYKNLLKIFLPATIITGAVVAITSCLTMFDITMSVLPIYSIVAIISTVSLELFISNEESYIEKLKSRTTHLKTARRQRTSFKNIS